MQTRFFNTRICLFNLLSFLRRNSLPSGELRPPPIPVNYTDLSQNVNVIDIVNCIIFGTKVLIRGKNVGNISFLSNLAKI